MNIELLEPRIAPAAVLHYIDSDGDLATLTVSKGTLAQLTAICDFSNANPAAPRTLQLIDFGAAPLDATGLSMYYGANVTLTVKRGPGITDGVANVGYIDASGDDGGMYLSLGTINIAGDLGQINAGQGTPGVKSLTVRSMGRLGTTTQNAGGDLYSHIGGLLGALVVKGDFVDANLEAGSIGSVTIGGSIIGVSADISTTGGGTAPGIGAVKIGGNLQDGAIESMTKIGNVTIGGSLIGGRNGGDGRITAVETIGAVKIGHDVAGGGGSDSGQIFGPGGIGSVTIGGSILAGSGDRSGQITASSIGSIGAVRIGRDVIGGIRDHAGEIFARTIKSLTIGGSLIGGAGESSGGINVTGTLGPVEIGHDVLGGGGQESAEIYGGDGIGKVTIGGSLIAGDGADSARIFADPGGSIGAVVIGHDVIGGIVSYSAQIFADAIKSVTIGGSLIGGAGLSTGSINANGTLGPVKIGHNVLGGNGEASGQISGAIGIASVKIGGSLIGGAGDRSGAIITSAGDASIGPVVIGHDVIGLGDESGRIHTRSLAGLTIGGSLIGGAGSMSGNIESVVTIGAVKIGGDLRGGTGGMSGVVQGGRIAAVTVGGSLIGGSVTFSGVIRGDLGPVKIAHDLRGGSATSSVYVDLTGAIIGTGRIASVVIGGSVISGHDSSSDTLLRSGIIFADDDIGSLTIKGSVIGHPDIGQGASPVLIIARGQQTPGATSDVAFGKISIGGSVDYARILAGLSYLAGDFIGVNADAQIGAVSVGGDWIASSIAAGAINLGNDDAVGGTGANADNVNFGNSHDAKISQVGGDDANIVSRIASITIRGQVFGTDNLFLDRFGFVAEEIAAFKFGGFKVPLLAHEHNDGSIEIGPFNDVRIHEILTP